MVPFRGSLLQMPEFQEAVENITGWINHELGDSSTRIRVTDLKNDLYDGVVLKVLLERLSGESVAMPAGEFVQSEERQRINLRAVLDRAREILGVREEEVTYAPQTQQKGF